MNTDRFLSIVYRAFLVLGIILVVTGLFSDRVVMGIGVIFGVIGLWGLSFQRAHATPCVRLGVSNSVCYANKASDETDWSNG